MAKLEDEHNDMLDVIITKINKKPRLDLKRVRPGGKIVFLGSKPLLIWGKNGSPFNKAVKSGANTIKIDALGRYPFTMEGTI